MTINADTNTASIGIPFISASVQSDQLVPSYKDGKEQSKAWLHPITVERRLYKMDASCWHEREHWRPHKSH